MKIRISLPSHSPVTRAHRAFVVAVALLLACQSVRADLYWDIDGLTEGGSGTTSATGNWNGTTTNWNSDPTGGPGGTGILTGATTGSDILHFSAGTDVTGSYTVTASGTRPADSLVFEEGNVTLTGGTVDFGSGAGGISVASGRSITINSLLAGTNGLTKTGAGTLLLGTGNATANAGLSGTISIREGRIVAGSVTSGTANATNGLLISLGDTSGTGGATFSVNRNHNYSSNVTVNAGSTGIKRLSGGPGLSATQTPSILGAVTLNDDVTLGNGSGGDAGGVNLAGVITGSRTITIDGATAYTDAAAPGTIAIIRGASGSTFTGGVVINRGVLRIGSVGAIGTGTATVSTSAGSALDLGHNGTTGSSISIAGLNNGASTGGVVTNHSTGTATAVLTLAGGGNYSYGGVIADGATSKIGVTVNLAGTGSQTLTGANTYTGATSITGGTLALGATGSIDNTGGISLASGGNFDVSAKSGYTVASLTGSGNVLGALTVSTTLAIGGSPGSATFGGDLTLGSTAISHFEFSDNTFALGTYDLAQGGSGSQTVNFGGGVLNLLFSGGTYAENSTVRIFDFENYSGTFGTVNVSGLIDQTAAFDSLTGSVTITAIPEPSALLLGGLGCLGLLRRRR
ncbi:MAG: autotransporter-associated beta strand repeat-containing protein [Verrucomicrobiota bacterium]